MKPKQHKTRTAIPGGPKLEVRDVNDTPSDVYDDYFEDSDINLNNLSKYNEKEDQQKQRIEALKRAIDIAKLMSNVTTEDIIEIAKKIINYLKNTEI